MFFNNSITTIEDGTFDDFTILEFLVLRNTSLKEITENLLTQKLGSHLKLLDLSYNKISFISPLAFQYMVNIYSLGLAGNPNIEKFLNHQLFSKSLVNLKDLNLSDSNITKLDDDLFVELKNLKMLSLSKNPFISIPKAINFLPKIYYMSLDATNITSLKNDKEIHNQYLQVLSMTNSEHLISLDDCAFCGLSNLWHIFLNCNQKLSKINENVFGSIQDMPELSEVSLIKINQSIIPKKLYERRIEIFLKHKKGLITECGD